MGVRDIYIVGAGGQGREAAWVVESINSVTPAWRVAGFVEATSDRIGSVAGRYSIVKTDGDLTSMTASVVICIGDPRILAKVVERYRAFPKLDFPNLVHPSVAWDRERIKLGVGNVICAGSVLTTDISIGSFTYINTNCSVGHDTVIGNCCVVNPGATISGNVTVGDAAQIGAGATVLQDIRIGAGAIVGAGAVVRENVAAGETVVGVPARPIRSA